MCSSVFQADTPVNITNYALNGIGAYRFIMGRQAPDKDGRVRGLWTFVANVVSQRFTGDAITPKRPCTLSPQVLR
jgi:hypothetical protein